MDSLTQRQPYGVQRCKDIVNLKGKRVKINNRKEIFIKEIFQLHPGKHGTPRFRITDDDGNIHISHIDNTYELI